MYVCIHNANKEKSKYICLTFRMQKDTTSESVYIFLYAYVQNEFI